MTGFRLCSVGLFVVACASEPVLAPPPEPEEEDWLPSEPTPNPVAAAEPREPESAPEPVPIAAPEQETPTVVARAAAAVPAAKPSGRKKPDHEAAPPTANPPSEPVAEPVAAEPAVPSESVAPAPVQPPAVAPVVPPKSVAPRPTAAQRLSGRYRYAGGSTQKSKIADAVDAVVGQMSIISRGIARRRLLSGAEPPRTLALSIEGKTVHAKFDDRAYQATLGAGAVRVKGRSGDPLDFTVRMRGDQLMLHFRGRKGGKKYVMRADDAGRLRMRVSIYSSSLPDKIVYQLTYRDA